MKNKLGIDSAEPAYQDCAPLFDFCRSRERIFLYGAGDYAGKYTLLLNSEDIDVTAYIVTDDKHAAQYYGCPVYSAGEAKSLLREGDGIVAAFSGSDPQWIMEKLGARKEDILSFDHRLMNQVLMPIMIKRIMEGVDTVVPERCETLPRDGVRNILLLRIDFIGDMVYSTAFFREIKRNYPDASVSLLCNKMSEPLMRNCPYFERVYSYEQNDRNRGFFEIYNTREALQEKTRSFVRDVMENRKFDIVLLARELLFGPMSAEELLLACQIVATYRVGCIQHDGGFSLLEKQNILAPLFSKLVLLEKTCTFREQPLATMRACGLTVEDDATELWLTNEMRRSAQKKLKKRSFDRAAYIAVALKGSAAVRCWDKENYRKLFFQLHKLYGEKIGIIILGGKDAEEDAVGLEGEENVISFAGKLPLDESAAMMSLCDLYIGPSTSLLHIATALRVPSVTLYHVLDESSEWFDLDGPPQWAPTHGLPHVSLLPPPGLDGCRGWCCKPYAHCINQITPEQVCAAVKETLRIS